MNDWSPVSVPAVSPQRSTVWSRRESDPDSAHDSGWQRFHGYYFQASAAAPADLAERARPRLVLCHRLSGGGVPLDSIAVEVRRGYRGRVVSGQDLDVY